MASSALRAEGNDSHSLVGHQESSLQHKTGSGLTFPDMRHGLMSHPPSLQSPPLLPASSHCYQPLHIAAIHLPSFWSPPSPPAAPHGCRMPPSLQPPPTPVPSRAVALGDGGRARPLRGAAEQSTARGFTAAPAEERDGMGRDGTAELPPATPAPSTFLPSLPPRRELTLLGFLLPGQGPAELAQERLLFLHPVRPQRRGAEGSGGHRLCRGPCPALPDPARCLRGPRSRAEHRERGITGPSERGQPAVCARSTGGGLGALRPQRPATAGKSAGGGGGTSLGHPRGRAPSPPEQHLRPGGRAPPPGHLVRRTHAGAGKNGQKASRQNNTPGPSTAGQGWC